MVISKIVGGLGNQMFQYAIGRMVAEQAHVDFQLDIADFKTYRRPYYLDAFQIQESYLADERAAAYRKYEKRHSVGRFIEDNFKAQAKRSYRLEKETEYFVFQPEYLVPAPHGDTYFNGYWQNEAYFLPIRDILLKEFQLKNHFSYNKEAFEQSESIAVHFRRGDDQLKKSYGAPSLEYYRGAVQRIAESYPQKNVQVFVFSNDPDWVRENFSVDFPMKIFTPRDNLTDFQELDAMRSCKHQVISNSTFSWWAAWLNNHPQAMKIAPERWFFNDPSIPLTKTPVPPTWTKLG